MTLEINKMFILTCFFFLVEGFCVAQRKTDPFGIDRQLEQCLLDTFGVVGQTYCIIEAQTKWLNKLNEIYDLLLKELSPNEKNALENSHNSWLKFFESDKQLSSLIENYYFKQNPQATIFLPIASEKNMILIKNRTLDLYEIYRMIKT